MGAKLPVAGLIILLLQVAQFEPLRRPAIILLTTATILRGFMVS